MHFSCHQPHHKDDVVSYQTPSGPYLDVEEIGRRQSPQWAYRHSLQAVFLPRSGAGSIPADFNTAQTVLRVISYLGSYKAPEIRLYPQSRFSSAIGSANSRTASAFRGRPDFRIPLESYF